VTVKLPPEDKITELLGCYRRGELDQVERLARSMTRKWPDYDLGWNVLSAALHARGKLDKAARVYEKAIAVSPDHAELRDNYGALLLQQSRLEEAEQQFREAIRLNPKSAKARANLAMALLTTNAVREAAEMGRSAVDLEPGNAAAHNILGNALKAQQRFEAARDAYERATRLNPAYATAHYNLATLLQSRGEVREAESRYRRAIETNPRYAKAHCGLGNLLAMSGRLEEAESGYRDALQIEPALIEAHRYLAWIKTFEEADADLARIEALIDAGGLEPGELAQLHYAAGKAREDIGNDPDGAFEHFARGAVLLRRGFGYDIELDETQMAAVAEAFPRLLNAGGSAVDDVVVTPVFIVGMPRSGTTLVEQILAAHSGVHPLGETSALSLAVSALDETHGSAYPGWVSAMAEEDARSLRSDYMGRIGRPGEGLRMVTDKTPENFRYLGLIARAMPQARIVHVRRSPLDTCVSCFTQYFSSWVPYSYDLEELGRYYRAYHGLMSHWSGVLPASMVLELEYESLTAAPREETRRLLDHCGLEWEEGCLQFQNARRLVETASVAQARKPVSRRSVGRWKRYERHLGPLKEALGDLAF